MGSILFGHDRTLAMFGRACFLDGRLASLHFSDAFASELYLVSVMHDAVEYCVGNGGVANSVILVSPGQLRGDDGGFSSVPVFDDVEQYRVLFCVDWHEEGIVKDEQLAAFYLLELRLHDTLVLCHLERA